jgi:hypothetical protein
MKKILKALFQRMGLATSSEEEALWQFRRQFDVLQEEFFRMASSSGKPRGLRWLHCEWLPTRAFVRDVQSEMLSAYVGVNVQFEAVEGGDMEGVEAVSLIRDGSAVFHYQNGQWGTGGRLLFNMSPELATSRLGEQFEIVDAAIIGQGEG